MPPDLPCNIIKFNQVKEDFNVFFILSLLSTSCAWRAVDFQSEEDFVAFYLSDQTYLGREAAVAGPVSGCC